MSSTDRIHPPHLLFPALLEVGSEPETSDDKADDGEGGEIC